MADVAKAAGVSRTTASLVMSGRARELRISEDVEQRVTRAAAELEYRTNMVSVSLRTGSTRTIGFISDTVATTQLAGDLIKGALEAARERGVMLFIGETEGDAELEQLLLRAMHDRHVDGLILTSMFTRTITVPKDAGGTPTVLLNALSREPSPLSSVVPDEIRAGRSVARALLKAGHREGIYVIGAGPGLHDGPPESVASVERLIGIRDEFAAAGVSVAGARACPDWQPEYGLDLTRDLLRTTRPRALICLNDRVAFGAYQALEDAGLTVPTDVSVVSFDDHPLASWMRPTLTTVALPHYALGRKAVDVLFDEIGNQDKPRREGVVHRVTMPLCRRKSVAPPLT